MKHSEHLFAITPVTQQDKRSAFRERVVRKKIYPFSIFSSFYKVTVSHLAYCMTGSRALWYSYRSKVVNPLPNLCTWSESETRRCVTRRVASQFELGQ